MNKTLPRGIAETERRSVTDTAVPMDARSIRMDTVKDEGAGND